MKKERTLFDIIAIIFLVLGMIVAGIIIVSLVTFNREDRIIRWSDDFQGEWYRVYPDGTKQKVSKLIATDVASGEDVVFETKLPDEIPNDAIIGMFTYRDGAIYIDDKLRAEFTNDDNPVPGKNVKNFFLEVKLTEADKGKTLKVVKEVVDNHNGAAYIYYGDSLGIFHKIFKKYGLQFCLATMLFFISAAFAIGSIFAIGKYSEWKALFSISIAFVGVTLWHMVDSFLIQFIFGIYYVDGMWGYLITMLFIFPFIYFINNIQRRRYEKCAIAVSIIMLIDFFVISYLHFADIYDFNATRPFMNVIVALGIIYVAATLIVDIFRGYAKEYRSVVLGTLVISICGIIEIAAINSIKERLDGIMLLAGLYFFLIMSMVQIYRQMRLSRDKELDAIRASELKSEFLASMSHEIRTPINAIMGMNEMILRENENEDIEEYATNIQSASNNLLTIINDILDFSKIESGKMELVNTDYSLSDVYNDVATMLEIKANDKSLKFVKNIDDSLPDKLNGDAGKIRQIMINILNNAVKYTKAGQVDFSVNGDVNGDTINIKVVVKDTGIGIKSEDIDKLFKKFSRVDEKKNTGIEGTGLGLAITKQFIDMMNGTVEVKSKYGHGSTFTLVIPQKIVDRVTVKEVSKEKQGSGNKKVREEGRFTANDARILVVDDVEMNLVVIRGLLKKTDITIDTALSGKECIELVKKNKYHIVFMDHMMPEMDGIETLRIIKEDKSHPNQDTPVIILTANAIVGAQKEYEEAGFVDYLSKPVDSKMLDEMVLKYLPKELIKYNEQQA